MKNVSIVAIAMLFGSGCATTAPKLEAVDNKITVKGNTQEGVMGLDTKGNLVIQKEIEASDALRMQQSVNAFKKERLEREYYDLKLCVRDMSDPRLSGKGFGGKLPSLNVVDNYIEEKEQMGTDEQGNIKIVTRKSFTEQLNSSRKLEKTLDGLYSLVVEQLDDCTRDIAVARNKVGLPGNRYVAEGYFAQNGTWVELRKGERNLSDAFEIQGMLKANSSGQ